MDTVNRLFSEGFRIFFLSAGVFGVFTGLIWSLFLAGSDFALQFAPPPVTWHAHEMIFGYASAAIGGFFLTAVPNWTDTPGAGNRYILMVSGLWFAGRLAIWCAGLLPPVVVAAVDLSFVPLLTFKIVLQLVKRPKPQNMMFVLFLAYYWIANLLVHLEWMGVTENSAETGLTSGLIVLSCLIAVLGGRVTPAFTRNAMKRAGVAERSWPRTCSKTERASLVLSLLLPLLVLVAAPSFVVATIAILFGLVQGARLSRWRAPWCLSKPILLALHLGLTMLVFGMVLWGMGLLGLGSPLVGIHILGIGCVGGMTLAVMSRAALGHSGRELIASPTMATGYLLMALAALARWFGAETDALYQQAMILSGVLWIAAFGLFLISMWSPLTQPRMPKS